VTFGHLQELVSPEFRGSNADYLSYQTILVVANVTEQVTGKVLSGNSTVRCHPNMYQLEFLDITPDTYKPGLEFTGYVSLFCSLFIFFIVHHQKS